MHLSLRVSLRLDRWALGHWIRGGERNVGMTLHAVSIGIVARPEVWQ